MQIPIQFEDIFAKSFKILISWFSLKNTYFHPKLVWTPCILGKTETARKLSLNQVLNDFRSKIWRTATTTKTLLGPRCFATRGQKLEFGIWRVKFLLWFRIFHGCVVALVAERASHTFLGSRIEDFLPTFWRSSTQECKDSTNPCNL